MGAGSGPGWGWGRGPSWPWIGGATLLGEEPELGGVSRRWDQGRGGGQGWWQDGHQGRAHPALGAAQEVWPACGAKLVIGCGWLLPLGAGLTLCGGEGLWALHLDAQGWHFRGRGLD